MKNISNKTKKWLVVGGCLVACVVLVVLIGSRFTVEPQTDEPIPSQSSQPSDVKVDTNAGKEKDVVVAAPDVSESVGTDSSNTPSGNVADNSGTDQSIQGDVTKPEYTNEQLTDPSQKPNGEPAKTTPPAQPSSSPSSSSGSSNGGGLPGFDNVPDGGANQATSAGDMYENGNKIGEMN
jgi:negative regulator of sigma E activity